MFALAQGSTPTLRICSLEWEARFVFEQVGHASCLPLSGVCILLATIQLPRTRKLEAYATQSDRKFKLELRN